MTFAVKYLPSSSRVKPHGTLQSNGEVENKYVLHVKESQRIEYLWSS